MNKPLNVIPIELNTEAWDFSRRAVEAIVAHESQDLEIEIRIMLFKFFEEGRKYQAKLIRDALNEYKEDKE